MRLRGWESGVLVDSGVEHLYTILIHDRKHVTANGIT